MNEQHRAAAELLAAMTDAEAAAFVAEARAPGPPPQLSRADLAGMRPAEIEAARVAGQLDTLMGAPPAQVELKARAARQAPLTRAEVAELYRVREYELLAGYSAHTDRITN